MNYLKNFWDWYLALYSHEDPKVRLTAWTATLATITFLLVYFIKPLRQWMFKKKKIPTIVNSGGKGGNATVVGQYGNAIGGRGGGTGPGGQGGDGGSAEAKGDHGFAIGGDGGEAG